MKFTIKTTERIGELKTVISSVITRVKSPEEVLEMLDRFGIESFVTEEGDLLIRFWQVGKEDFVSPEHAAIIRSKRPSPKQSDELDWLSKHLEDIRREYGGQWIAIYENEIVAAAATLPSLLNQIAEYDKPFITFIPSEPIVWTFTYAS